MAARAARTLRTRLVSMDVADMPNAVGHPFQSRAMDKTDIRNFRRWHRNAALRAKAAGFDIVYVYATHGYLLAHFLDPETNTRSDEYGGQLENRTRLVRELIAETKDAVGDRCAVAVRFAADERDRRGRCANHGRTARDAGDDGRDCPICGTSTSPTIRWKWARRASSRKARWNPTCAWSGRSPRSPW